MLIFFFFLNKHTDIETSTSEFDSNEDNNEFSNGQHANDDEIDDEKINDDDKDDLFNYFEPSTDRHFTSREIAITLSLLKTRHALTQVCITHICKLLKMLRVPNAPTDYRNVRSLICSPIQTNMYGDTLIGCTSCHQISKDFTRCSTTANCLNKEKFIAPPTITHILRMEPQIRSIVERNTLTIPNNNLNQTRDIIESKFYRQILENHTDPIITLLMNSDGAVVKSISRSIWLTTFVINELPWNVRFKRENMIIGMISSGSIKPSKIQMQLFLKQLTKELLYLEENGLQIVFPSEPIPSDRIARVFVLGAVCDKPAASLLINHTEAGGYYGCIHCNIVGMLPKRTPVHGSKLENHKLTT